VVVEWVHIPGAVARVERSLIATDGCSCIQNDRHACLTCGGGDGKLDFEKIRASGGRRRVQRAVLKDADVPYEISCGVDSRGTERRIRHDGRSGRELVLYLHVIHRAA